MRTRFLPRRFDLSHQPIGPKAAREAWAEATSGRALRDLLATVRDASYGCIADDVMSVFGRPDLSALWRQYSEYGLLGPYRPGRALRYVADVGLPSIPLTAPTWFPEVLSSLFWHPTLVDVRPDQNNSVTTFPHETWIFINGIMTNSAVAQLNAASLTSLFHRPMVLVENATGGLAEDLWECASDKAACRTGEAAVQAIPVIYDAIRDPDKARVVVIAHSQGTIIAGVALRFFRWLRDHPDLAAPTSTPPEAVAAAEELAPPEPVRRNPSPLAPRDFAPPSEADLAKLEIYCFANCSSRMEYLDPDLRVPWIESYGNEHDIVARLGMFAPRPGQHNIKIDGPMYIGRHAWGHLLNAHYLHAIARAQQVGRQRGPRRPTAEPFTAVGTAPSRPRLYGYINGGTPPRLPAQSNYPPMELRLTA